MDEGFFVDVFFVALLTLAVIGGVHLVMDFRHFDEAVKQCTEQGYIQNKTTRIKCAVEK